MNDKNFTHLFEEDLSKENWSQLKLWNKIQPALPPQRRPLRLFMKPLRTAAVLASFLGLIVLFVSFTTPGRAFAQQIWRFFTQTELKQAAEPIQSEELLEFNVADPVVSIIPISEKPDNCNQVWCNRLSFEDVQRLAGFELATLDPIPEGFRLAGAQLLGDRVYTYYSSARGDLVLIQSPLEMQVNMLKNVGTNANVESVQVGKYPAELVQGDWASFDPYQQPAWDPDVQIKSLRWQTETLDLELMAVPNLDNDTGFDIQKEEMLLVGENLSYRLAADVLPELNQESLDQAELKAGFKATRPEFLPEGYQFDHAALSVSGDSLCQYFTYGPKKFPALYIAQSPVGWAREQIVSNTAAFMGQTYDRTISEEELVLGNTQATYFGTGVRHDTVCSKGGYLPHQAVLFEHDGMHYAVFGWGQMLEYSNVNLTRAEMLNISAGLLGLSENEFVSETNKFTSQAAAEEYLGFQLSFPEKMLPGYHFSEIDLTGYSVEGNDQPVQSVSTLFMGPDSGLPWLDYMRIDRHGNVNENDPYAYESIMGWGGFKEVEVWGMKAIYREYFYLIPDGNGLEQCMNWLYWFDGDTVYGIETQTGTRISEETILQIAESMKP